MDRHKILIGLVQKYRDYIKTAFLFLVPSEMRPDMLRNAARVFAPGLTPEQVIGFYDTTLTSSGKRGYLFTDTGVYYKEPNHAPKQLSYSDISRIELDNCDAMDCERGIQFYLADGTCDTWTSPFLNKTPLAEKMPPRPEISARPRHTRGHVRKNSVLRYFGAVEKVNMAL